MRRVLQVEDRMHGRGTPALPAAQSANLTSVSCPALLVCTATGFFTDAAHTETVLAERYS